MDALDGSPGMATRYVGNLSGTIRRSVQFRCKCGHLAAHRLVVGIDAAANGELARTATAATLHQIICPGCQQTSKAQISYTYHDARTPVFILVLPDSHRHRELEERAALLSKLSQDDSSVPLYVVNFGLAFGAKDLSEFLQDKQIGTQEDVQVSQRQAEIDVRLEEVARRELQLRQRAVELERFTDELKERGEGLEVQETSILERKAALDRRSEELKLKTAVVEKKVRALRAEGHNMVGDGSTEVLGMQDILTSAPDPNTKGELAIPSRSEASGISTHSPLPSPDVDDPHILENDGLGVTPKSTSVLADTEPDLNDTQDQQLQHSQARERLDNLNATVPLSRDPEVDRWLTTTAVTLKRVKDDEVILLSKVHGDTQEELLASDIRALLQFHRMPRYPLITLTLARAQTLTGKPGKPFSFYFDIGSGTDRAVLERLAKDFRFRLDVYQAEGGKRKQRRLTAPLAANIRYVMAAAADAHKELSESERSFAAGVKAYEDSSYDRLGRNHRLAREFKDTLLDKLASPEELLSAVTQCERFSSPEGEEYLVAIRSYPLDRWHRRRLAVIEAALALGLWPGSALARAAVSEEIVRSRRELVAVCKRNFTQFVSDGAKGLSRDVVVKNQEALAAESSALKKASGTGKARDSSDGTEVSGLIVNASRQSSDEIELPGEEPLLKKLDDPASRLEAIVALSQLGTRKIDAVFGALVEVPAGEAAVAFAAVVALGARAADALLVLLRCPSICLRHGAALALCSIRDDEGIDSVSEMLMTDDGTLWHEFAWGLGQVGSTAVMPVVARIGGYGERGQTRGAWALARIVAGDGLKGIKTLQAGRNKVVASAATEALEIAKRIASGAACEREPTQKVFSERYYQALQGKPAIELAAETSGPAMLLEESDLLEAEEFKTP